MMTERNNTPQNFLSNDNLWAMAAQNQPISRADLGITSTPSDNGLQTFTEGFDLSRLFNSD